MEQTARQIMAAVKVSVIMRRSNSKMSKRNQQSCAEKNDKEQTPKKTPEDHLKRQLIVPSGATKHSKKVRGGPVSSLENKR